MKSDIKIFSINLETEYPIKITSNNPKNNQPENNNISLKYDINHFTKLIVEGDEGLARFLIQEILYDDSKNKDLLELILKTNDENVSIYQYIEWCRELLVLDSGNQFALKQMIKLKEKLNERKERKKNKLVITQKTKKGIRDIIEENMINDNLEESIKLVEDILKEDSENSYALRTRAIIYTKMKRFDIAAHYWSEWIEGGNRAIDDIFRTARAHYNAKHFNETLNILKEIEEKYENEEKILDLIIRSHYSLFKWDSCYKKCEEILKINNRNLTGLKYRRLTYDKITDFIIINDNQEYHDNQNYDLNEDDIDIGSNSFDENKAKWYDYI